MSLEPNLPEQKDLHHDKTRKQLDALAKSQQLLLLGATARTVDLQFMWFKHFEVFWDRYKRGA